MEEEEEGGGAGWLVSYADLMTLLFAAFVVLYGITPQGESTEILGIIASIRESFVEIPDELPESFRDKESFKGKMIFKEVGIGRVFIMDNVGNHHIPDTAVERRRFPHNEDSFNMAYIPRNF